MDRTVAHQNLVKQFTVKVAVTFPELIVLPYTVGMFRAFDDPNRIVRAGLKGVFDMIVLGCGWYLFFDAKTGKAVLTKEQRAFKNRVTDLNGGQVHAYKLGSVAMGMDIIKGVMAYHEKI